MPSTIKGRTYLERGEPVVVICGWAGKGPHNVWFRRADGTEVVRPFRGLRKPHDTSSGGPDE
jgi:acetyl esterase